MNKTRFRLLVFFMSLSLIGIILVQLYWINSSLQGNSQQFKFNVQQVLSKVTGQMQNTEENRFSGLYREVAERTGKTPTEADLSMYELNKEGKFVLKSDADIQSGSSKNSTVLGSNVQNVDSYPYINRFQEKLLYKAFMDKMPIDKRIAVEDIERRLETGLKQRGIDTDFEYAVYEDNHATKLKSRNFKWDIEKSESHNIFEDLQGNSRYRLLISFPEKDTYLFESLIGITALSVVFTLIIIIAYLSAINQLIKQKQISEIKSDFINNMTHEFKTPIATINLALDAIRNPRIFDDREKVSRYLQMIRDENKRMHAQVENVLQISKLDKKELDIEKEPADIQQIIESAIEHVHLIIEARQGSLTRHFHAQRTTALLNEVHFTNVIVNILDNAIKYSPDEPLIDVYTENVKDFIMIKIRDRGLGMSKTTLKRIFEKFYREHTGDIHNVKGHGLGLAYVKRIIDDHNCHIYVESEKGKGSTFIIKMPLIN